MAQDPEQDEGQPDEPVLDPSHDLDLVTLFESLAPDAEMEADVLHGILESNGVPSFLLRGSQYPSLGYQLQVPRARLDEARRLIAEAEAAGPEAAAEAEASSEETH